MPGQLAVGRADAGEQQVGPGPQGQHLLDGLLPPHRGARARRVEEGGHGEVVHLGVEGVADAVEDEPGVVGAERGHIARAVQLDDLHVGDGVRAELERDVLDRAAPGDGEDDAGSDEGVEPRGRLDRDGQHPFPGGLGVLDGGDGGAHAVALLELVTQLVGGTLLAVHGELDDARRAGPGQHARDRGARDAELGADLLDLLPLHPVELGGVGQTRSTGRSARLVLPDCPTIMR